jgi:hypothetical protein
MERLYQVVRVLAFASCWAFGTCIASAEGVCSLRVRVLSPDGRRTEAPISVKEESGRTIEKDHENDDVEFCDLGILPVAVTVGSDGLCNQITIRDVPVTWNEPYLLRVTYDPDACRREHGPPPPMPICHILFRVSDSGGKWIPRASVKFSSPTSDSMKADEYGRAEFVTKVGDEARGSVAAAGFDSANFKWTCSRSEPLHEESVKLKKP